MKKLFIVQKFVLAESAEKAIKIEKSFAPTSVFMDDDFKKTHLPLKEFELKIKPKK